MDQLYSYLTNPATIINFVVFVFSLWAMRANFNSKLNELEKRIQKIEDLDLDSRLTRMEANLDWIRTTLEKLDRLHRLNEVVNKYSNEANKKMEGTIVKCLVTSLSDKDKSKVCGYTENMKLVNIIGDASLIGKIVDVKITDAKSFSLDGEYIKE